jgi:hypothetical protein
MNLIQSSRTAYSHLFLGFPTALLPYTVFCRAFLGIRSSFICIICPSDTPTAEIKGKAKEPTASECIEPKTVDKGTPRDTLSTAQYSSEGKGMEKLSVKLDERRQRKRLHHEICSNQLTP